MNLAMKAFLSTVASIALLSGARADPFEGKITLSVKPWRNQGHAEFHISAKEDLMRIDVEAPSAKLTTIVDFKLGQQITLVPQSQSYLALELQNRSPAGGPPGPLQETADTDTILGYVCTKYVAAGPEGITEIWATDQLGEYRGLYQFVGPMGRGQPQSWEALLSGRNLFPLRVLRTNRNKSLIFLRIEATSVEKTSLPGSLFEAPGGWKKLSLNSPGLGAVPAGRFASR
jgi:hypothetical protein